ncbi:MAG: hypothetical protein M3533_02415 [Actinomycetota bacterium]|jgi:hypothetical protein|nr:hypothetical protein [Actinomycetota bacterium]
MPEDAIENREEVKVGHHILVSDGRPPYIGEIVRFRGKLLGWYTADTSIDDSRLKRKDITCALYRCPRGYRVRRSEVYYQRRRERSRWTTTEAYTSLLPTVNEEDAGVNEQTPGYGLYTEEEARRAFPDLFSAVGMPNVRQLD